VYETVIQLDLAQDDLYARHKKVAHLMALPGLDARDYLFAVSDDGQQVYLRASQPRQTVGGWREVIMPEQGQRHTVSGVIYIDATRLSPEKRSIWRLPQSLRGHVAQSLQPVGDIDTIEVTPLPGMPMSKPGMPPMIWTPIAFVSEVMVRNQDAAAEIVRRGIGRGKAFGFGCVHFRRAGGRHDA
jgi:hypothetical protein